MLQNLQELLLVRFKPLKGNTCIFNCNVIRSIASIQQKTATTVTWTDVIYTYYVAVIKANHQLSKLNEDVVNPIELKVFKKKLALNRQNDLK